MSVLLYWKLICNDINNIGKISNFIKSTKTNSPSSHSGAPSLPPIGNSFMYIERSSNNHSVKMFLSVRNELVFFRLLIWLSLIIDFQF